LRVSYGLFKASLVITWLAVRASAASVKTPLVFLFCSCFPRGMKIVRSPLDRVSAAALFGLMAGWSLAELLLLASG
jgi:hypothetical protein